MNYNELRDKALMRATFPLWKQLIWKVFGKKLLSEGVTLIILRESLDMILKAFICR